MNFYSADGFFNGTDNKENFFAQCFASHFYFRQPYSEGKSLKFPKNLTFSMISRDIKQRLNLYAENRLLIFLHLDEFYALTSSNPNAHLLDSIIRYLVEFMLCQSFDNHICILPLLTGTNFSTGNDSITGSKITPHYITLFPLSNDIIYSIIYKMCDTKIDQLKLKEFPSFKFSIESLGGIPRFAEQFIRSLNNEDVDTLTDRYTIVQKVYQSVIDGVSNLYFYQWNDIIKGHKLASINLIIFSLIQREIKLSDKLNGITVRDIQDSGVIFLKPTANQNLFTITLPITLIQAINQRLHFVDSKALDFTSNIDADLFESVMIALQTLRQNLLFQRKKYPGHTPITFRDLYPGAIGHQEDLNFEVPIEELEAVNCIGNQGNHEGVHSFDLNKMPIRGSESPINLLTSKKQYLIRNVPMAPSFDAFIFHSNNCKEAIQYKSYQDISNGTQPTRQICLTDIKKEIIKISNNHNRLYNQPSSTNLSPEVKLCLISNKPFKDFEKFKNELSTTPSITGFPKGLILVSNETFTTFAAQFAHFATFREYHSEFC